MNNDEAINVFETYLATGHVPYPYELREASRMAISALKGESPLPEDTVLFNKGVEEGKRLMMEEAVEGEIFGDIRSQEEEPYQIWAESDYLPLDGEFKLYDKVRVIILPKED